MRLSIVRAGGVAGLVSHTKLASEALADGVLEDKVSHSGLLDTSADRTPAPGERRPDELQYELTVEYDGRTTTQRFAERQLPASVRTLIEWADSVPQREDRLAPPGRD
ncbi:MAG: hypothetical protein QOE27_2598 [Solirubrobacteraceae bacterium]|nr:hypothetical protein [Solirubrobacteraceae bacterium]